MKREFKNSIVLICLFLVIYFFVFDSQISTFIKYVIIGLSFGLISIVLFSKRLNGLVKVLSISMTLFLVFMAVYFYGENAEKKVMHEVVDSGETMVFL